MSNENENKIVNPLEKTETLLEHNLMHREKKSAESSALLEANLAQREQHKQETVPLMEAQVELQNRTITKLNELIQNINSLNDVFREVFKKSRVKKFGLKSGEKKKLVLTKEIVVALKDLKTKVNDYKLLLKLIKKYDR
jgi:uncharacterized protein YdiU (UPF0061 family)